MTKFICLTELASFLHFWDQIKYCSDFLRAVQIFNKGLLLPFTQIQKTDTWGTWNYPTADGCGPTHPSDSQALPCSTSGWSSDPAWNVPSHDTKRKTIGIVFVIVAVDCLLFRFSDLLSTSLAHSLQNQSQRVRCMRGYFHQISHFHN